MYRRPIINNYYLGSVGLSVDEVLSSDLAGGTPVEVELLNAVLVRVRASLQHCAVAQPCHHV